MEMLTTEPLGAASKTLEMVIITTHDNIPEIEVSDYLNCDEVRNVVKGKYPDYVTFQYKGVIYANQYPCSLGDLVNLETEAEALAVAMQFDLKDIEGEPQLTHAQYTEDNKEYFDQIEMFAGIDPAPPIKYVDWLPEPRRGMCIPPFGIYIKKEFEGNDKILNHELKHWQQAKKMGVANFYARYFKEYFQHGYDHMPMEIEARFEEIPYCKENYTECVKRGLSSLELPKNEHDLLLGMIHGDETKPLTNFLDGITKDDIDAENEAEALAIAMGSELTEL